MAELGWIGLGDIGTPMALRLIDAGHSLHVWGRTQARLAPALERGARQAPSAADVAAACDAVFLCVPDSAAVEEIVFGPHGTAQASTAASLLVDHSTIHPARTRAFAARLREAGRGCWVDAPISGGAVGARAGTLAIMAGGAAEDVEKVRPWLAAYGGKITHVGDSGAGQLAKSCNQAIANSTIMVWAEMLAYAQGFGLDLEKLVAALEGGFADSSVRKHLVPSILSGAYPGHYGGIIPKDLDIPCDMARELQTALPVTSLVNALYRLHATMAERGSGAEGLLDLFRRNPRDGIKARL